MVKEYLFDFIKVGIAGIDTQLKCLGFVGSAPVADGSVSR